MLGRSISLRRSVARKMSRAYQDGDYAEALEFAQKIHKLRPHDVSAIYNIGCFHCLVGHKDKAYTWLEKAIEAGYDDAEHLVNDDDFSTICG